MLHIYVDADACPVKQEIYRVAKRYRLDVTLVANSRMRVPNERGITLQVVGGGILVGIAGSIVRKRRNIVSVKPTTIGFLVGVFAGFGGFFLFIVITALMMVGA